MGFDRLQAYTTSCVALTTLTLNPENIGRWTGNDQVVGEPQHS